MRKFLEDLKFFYPLACVCAGMCIAESDVAFFPWKVLALIMVGLSAWYVVRSTFHKRARVVERVITVKTNEDEH